MFPELCTDDFTELARVEQKRSLAASRTKAAPANPALLSMFASTMQLAQKGKITHKNAFQLQLIDHMADIIQQPDEADAAPSGRTPTKANKQGVSATGTPLSAAPAFTTPSARSPTTASPLSDHSAGSAIPSSATRPSPPPTSLSDITNRQKRPAAKQQVNFVKASSTLDASVMIYSGRVDNVHKDAYRMAGGLSAQQLEREEEAEENDEEGEAAGNAKRKRRAATRATIETRLSNLNMKAVERREDGDPFFKRMSAAFDAGGAKGMLTHQLSVYKGAEVALDGQLVVLQERQGHDVEGLTQHVDLSELSELLTQTASNWRQLSVCPLLREMEAIRDELEGKPARTEEADSSTRENETGPILPSGELSIAADANESLDDSFAGLELADSGVDLAELHADIEAAIVQEHSLDSHMARPMDDCDVDDTAAASADTTSAAAPTSMQSSPFVALGLFGAATDGSLGSQSQLAGMAHWKFKAAASTTTTTTQRQPRATKATAPIDFYAAPPPPSLFAAVAKRRLSALRLSAATLRKRQEPSARAALLRPTAATYDVAGLMRLFGRDNSVSIRSRHEQRAEERQQEQRADGAEAEAGGMAEAWDNVVGGSDDDGDNGTLPAFDTDPAAATGDNHSDFTLLTEPARVEQLSIGYARTAKRVDVKRLKECLWAGINSASTAKPDEEKESDEWEESDGRTAIAPITFQHAIDTLAGRYPAGALESVSVSYCFICVLHLCNERSLTLESDPLPPYHTAAGGAGQERRVNLSSFTIRATQPEEA